MNEIEFPRNYTDLSTDQGFQFEFHCDRCRTGYRTRFQPSTLGTVSSILDAAGSLFGGVFGRAADLGRRARSATWETAHDDAFQEAVQELKTDFVQCPRCSAWVCQNSCWNVGKGLCKSCAPDLGVEMAAAQASRTVDELRTQAQVAEEDQKMLAGEGWQANLRATCPECNAPLAANIKFCSQCGASLQTKQCRQCGGKLDPDAKFCGECGTKV